jgi:hypothetical protein
MATPIVLYSVNSWLAFSIAERYYSGQHYVWCAPIFDGRSPFTRSWFLPPTSSPAEIYSSLKEEVRRRDRHSAKIAQNRVGIVRGATIKKKAGVINDGQEAQIVSIVDAAELADFRPLVYVIPYHSVAHLAKEVPLVDKAHPLSAEWIIESLHRDLFDVIEEL